MDEITIVKINERYTIRVEKDSVSDYEWVMVLGADGNPINDATTSRNPHVSALADAARVIDEMREASAPVVVPRAVTHDEVKKFKKAWKAADKAGKNGGRVIAGFEAIGFEITDHPVPTDPGVLFEAEHKEWGQRLFISGADGYAYAHDGDDHLHVLMSTMSKSWTVTRVFSRG